MICPRAYDLVDIFIYIGKVRRFLKVLNPVPTPPVFAVSVGTDMCPRNVKTVSNLDSAVKKTD